MTTKYQAYEHLIDCHGQLWPETPKGWRRDEVDSTHRDHHRAGRSTNPAERSGPTAKASTRNGGATNRRSVRDD